MEENKDYVILRTYNSVWYFEHKIYSIENIKLLFPVNPDEVLYFAVSVGITMLLLKVLPFLDRIPFVIKYGAIPYGLMKFFTKQKLDGKLPHKFFIDYVIFVLSPKKSARFLEIEEYKDIKFITPIVMRDIEIVNKTEEALKMHKKGGKKGKCINSL